ncbi:septation protein SepH [Microcella sp.]|uniref:septation protein SepH n=1 Tax=Microcella sp. TaxID=1913979 RepID=UPI003F706763
MDELTVIGAENGALIVVSADGSRFRVPITEALHTALRQNRPAAPAPHRVGPREVQSLIRQGLTAAEVATQTGEPLEYIQRFEGPVLAEREYVVTAARTVPVAVASDGEAGVTGTFGSAIDHRLTGIGARDVRWESRKQESHWIVSVSFLDGDVARTAVWTFDPKKSTLAPANHEAQSLSQQGDGPAPIMPRLRAVPAEDAPSGRFDSGAFTPTPHPERPAAPLERPERPFARVAEPDTADTQEVGNTADLLEALRRRRGEREAAPSDDWESSRAAHPSTGSIRIVDVPLDGALIAAGGDEETEGIDDPVPESVIDDASLSGDTAEQTPVKPVNRRGRAAMPSWDEIVFGARPDDDPA